ncbi:zinc finger protein 585a [Colletotrichum musicola]|uniref:Zinc finger protein 585a n=1 Tax=Colletotrichum musicola TaxID=2175873 RepID=A0A8H6KB39_9PEZI|nr:zinc finger protein 585a [Colletotrichum musicola]
MPSDVLPKRGKKLRNGVRDFFKLNWKHLDKTRGRDGRNLPRRGTCQNEKQPRAPAQIDVNEDRPEETRPAGRTGVLLQSEHSPSKTWPPRGRADTIDSATQGQLNGAQHHQPAFNPPPPKRRLTGTWNTIRSASGVSVRTVASGLRKLVCIEPDLSGIDKRKNPKLPRAKSDLDSWTHIKRRQAQGCVSDIDEKSPAERSQTFPRQTSMEPSPGLDDIKQRLRQRAKTSAKFNGIWEARALPHLRDVLNNNRVDEYSIAIQFDYKISQRVVEVTSPKNKQLPDSVRPDVKLKIQSMFTKNALLVDVQFIEGVTVRSGKADANSNDDMRDAPGSAVRHFPVEESLPECSERPGVMLSGDFTEGVKRSVNTDINQDEGRWDPAGNPDDRLTAEALMEASQHPGALLLGDSIDREDGTGAATLGPAIHFGNEIGWLVSCHVFDDVDQLGQDHGPQLPECHIVHPGNIDCRNGRMPKRVARLRGYSGRMNQTQRQSRSIEMFTDNIVQQDRWVVTDWAVCVPEESEPRLLNRLRYAPKGREFQDCSGLVEGPRKDGPQLLFVRSSGRSSGLRWSVVCETLAVVKHKDQPPTREWYLENNPDLTSMSTDQWNSGGPGMPGDSGALIVDDETREMVGIIWGRTDYGATSQDPRRAYFTHIYDVFDDIFARYPGIGGYPRLEGQEVGPLALSRPPSSLPRNYNPQDYADGDGDGTALSSTPRRCGASDVSKRPSHESMDSGCVHVISEKAVEANSLFVHTTDRLVSTT